MVEVSEQRRVARDVGAGFELRFALFVPADEEVIGQWRLIAIEQREGGQDVAELGGRKVVESGDDHMDFSAQSGAFTEVEGGFGELDFGGDGDEASGPIEKLLIALGPLLRPDEGGSHHIAQIKVSCRLLAQKKVG